MRPIRVNADYDEVLAGSGPRPLQVRAIECLAFWVQDAPVAVEGNYDEAFLIHVAHHSGRMPRQVKTADAENWWGALADIPLERALNSKVWARDWWSARHVYEGGVAYDENELAALFARAGSGPLLIKRAQGMAGRGHRVVAPGTWEAERGRVLPWLAEGVVAEPLYQRTLDLSALWLPEENRFVYYRTDVDARFQWRGCHVSVNGLPDFGPEREAALAPWREQLTDLAREIHRRGYAGPFSVDAFFHLRDGEEFFYPCSEVNARKTMGWIAYHMARQWGRPGLLSAAGAGLELTPPGAPFAWTWRD